MDLITGALILCVAFSWGAFGCYMYLAETELRRVRGRLFKHVQESAHELENARKILQELRTWIKNN